MSLENVLITGGISDFSNALAEKLVFEESKNVILLHNYTSTYNKVDEKLSKAEKFRILNVDSIDEKSIISILTNNEIGQVFDVSLTTETTGDVLDVACKLLLGNTNVVDAIRKYGKVQSFVLISGEQVYSNSSNRVETAPLTPVEFVGSNMMAVEAMVHSYAVSYRIPTVIARIPALVLTDSEGFLKKLDATKDSFVNILSIDDVIDGVIHVSSTRDFTEPADVFNVANDVEFDREQLKKKSNNVETRQGTFANRKITETFGWRPKCDVLSELASGKTAKSTVEVKPTFLVYGGKEFAGKQFLKLLETNGIQYTESKVDVEKTTDVAVEEELTAARPSHVVFFSSNKEKFNGDCFILRTNMSRNLYVPWLLASACSKIGAHFTFVGTSTIFEYDEAHKQNGVAYTEEDSATYCGTSSAAVKGHTEKLLRHFENTLQCRVGLLVDSDVDDENLLVQVQSSSDLPNTPTSITVLPDCLPRILELTTRRITGVFNIVNNGVLSLADVAEIVRQNPKNSKTSTENNNLSDLISGPFQKLSCKKLSAQLGHVDETREAVRKCVEQLH